MRLRRACGCPLGRLHYRFNMASRMHDALMPLANDRLHRGEEFSAALFMHEIQERMTKAHHALAAVADPYTSENAKLAKTGI